MNLGDLLDLRAIAPRVGASSKRQVLSGIADIAGRSFGLGPEALLEALLEREAAGSTGVGYGVAVPHARLEGLERMHGVFVRLEQPVAFEAVDDQPVDLVFALFAPKDAGSDHLRALARVSRLLRQTEIREQLRHAKTPEAIYATLAQEAQPSAA